MLSVVTMVGVPTHQSLSERINLFAYAFVSVVGVPTDHFLSERFNLFAHASTQNVRNLYQYNLKESIDCIQSIC